MTDLILHIEVGSDEFYDFDYTSTKTNLESSETVAARVFAARELQNKTLQMVMVLHLIII